MSLTEKELRLLAQFSEVEVECDSAGIVVIKGGNDVWDPATIPLQAMRLALLFCTRIVIQTDRVTATTGRWSNTTMFPVGILAANEVTPYTKDEHDVVKLRCMAAAITNTILELARHPSA